MMELGRITTHREVLAMQTWRLELGFPAPTEKAEDGVMCWEAWPNGGRVRRTLELVGQPD